mmetsp:Transcript_31022/g.68826  ORF Transcript_31022/g.68826 Transcript_31022/m.68826 type:complete len:479 (-) Transcript_31022:805-2241(-)|eukprot:CAMPEP_0202916954 /NCGR_PEP_ID=MMETSP1392-20130828/69875_1 /ASSEMBLY_ACC=CAM_ASM_000868 /TAXON_ID=225041 /ORGANISM="Chlamydomonas chlamydogama, Strain SAG 11-48b" /LENGTH=478 /DNA_ID=CAMNT_0049609539 /DNA_START=284 /DNA_END=1720 /DNA_ORIENTATION=-
MKEEVKDSYGIVYFIFVLLGTGTLLPWNVFLTEKEFYDVRFKVEPCSYFIVDNFMGLFALAFNTLNLIALGFLIKYQKHLSLRVLVLQPLLITFIMLASTAALALKTDLSGDLMAKFTLPSIALMGLCTAMLQGGTLQLACIFSPVHIRGVVSGIAVGGVVTSVLSFVSQLRASDGTGTGQPTAEDVAPAAFMYFAASAAVVGACILGYSALAWLPYGRYKLLLAGIIDDPAERKLMTVDDDYEEPLLTVVEGDGGSTSTGSRVEHTRAAIISVETDYTQHHRSWQMRNAFNIYCLALFNCLFVTMSAHPGISSFICSSLNPAVVSPCTSRTSYGRLAGDLFVPLLYVLFAIGDFFGRVLSGYGPWSTGAPKPISILIYSVLRGAVAVAIMFCHVVTPTAWTLPEYLSTDYYPLGIILLLGLTQGHLISTICMHAPSTLQQNEQSKYGPVTSFAISMGCFLGSFVSLGAAYSFQTHTV